MNRKEIDEQILILANLLQMIVNLDKMIKTTKDVKLLNQYNVEYKKRFQQARIKATELNKNLDIFFKLESDNKNPIDFKLLQAKKVIIDFI